MRQEFILGGSREEAEAAMPWAAEIVAVDGGWRGWESAAEAETWENQE